MLRRGLFLFVLLLAAAWHGWGLWLREHPVSAAEAITLLRGQTIDAAQRDRCLTALRDEPAPDPRARLLAAAAAIALGDRAAYERILPGLGSARSIVTGEGEPWPQAGELDPLLRDAALGERWLQHFLRGQWLRAAGDPGARAELAAAAASATWSNAGFGAELAGAAVARLPAPGR